MCKFLKIVFQNYGLSVTAENGHRAELAGQPAGLFAGLCSAAVLRPPAVSFLLAFSRNVVIDKKKKSRARPRIRPAPSVPLPRTLTRHNGRGPKQLARGTCRASGP